jgi:hypothetical protein
VAWLRGRRLLLASVAAFAVVAGGVAYATIPDSTTGIIHGCYNKTTGALRVIDPSKSQSCATGETGLNWNQNGIRWRGAWNSAATYAVHDAISYNGQSYIARVTNTNTPPPGPDWALLASRGAAGAPGTPGPAGISTGVSAESGTSVALDQAQTLTPVLTAPAVATGGQYYVSASMMLVVGSGDTVTCITAVNGASAGVFATVGPVPNQTYETLPLAVTLSVPAGAVISVTCSDYTSNTNTSFYDGGITATQITSDNAPAAAVHAAAKPKTLPRALGGAAR